MKFEFLVILTLELKLPGVSFGVSVSKIATPIGIHLKCHYSLLCFPAFDPQIAGGLFPPELVTENVSVRQRP